MRGRIILLNSVFPILSETFIFDQFESLRQMGVPFSIVSTKRPAIDQVHPRMRAVMDEVFYLQEARLPEILGALLMLLVRHPLRSIQCLARLFFMEERVIASLAHLVGAALVLRRYGDTGDNWHHSHFTYSSSAVALWAKRLAGLPYSMTLHGADLTFDVVPDLEAKLNEADVLISISEYNIRYIEEHFPRVDTGKVLIIPLGVPEPDAEPAFAAIHADRPLRLFTVGRLSEHKAQHILLDACALLRERGVQFHCSIVGEGPERGRLEEQIDRLELHGQVSLLGQRYHHEVLELLGEADLFVMTSIVEGMPVAIMEAMVAGVPVIAPEITGIPELLGYGEGGILIPPSEPAALADAVARVAAGETDTRTLARNAFRLIVERFNLHANSRRFADFLKQRLSQTG